MLLTLNTARHGEFKFSDADSDAECKRRQYRSECACRDTMVSQRFEQVEMLTVAHL
jgi:hypothetical protein